MEGFKLYYVEWTNNPCPNYDQYDSLVVVAQSAEEARYTSPSGARIVANDTQRRGGDWPSLGQLDQLTVTEIGTASSSFNNTDVICSSFNAG